jgi:uncharacterized protein
MVRTAPVAFAVTLLLAVASTPAAAQTESAYQTERVGYVNSQDGTRLAAQLTMPRAGGPHPAIVLLSVAGTGPFVEGLVAEGYAVLAPELRGFVQVEPLLQATFEDLAGDVAAAVAYLRARQGIDGEWIAVVAQGDNTPQAMLYAAEAEVPVSLVLMAPPAFPGTEMFRLEQRWIAESQGGAPADLDALDAYVREIADIVLAGRTPGDRAFRLQALRARSTVQLPRNAAFPDDERQMHFFASRLWHDRLAFDPERALGRLHAPVLVMIGAEDPNTPMDAYLESVRRGLADARTGDAVVCRIAGRTRHTFSPTGVSTIAEWLAQRVGAGSEEGGAREEPGACLEDETGA